MRGPHSAIAISAIVHPQHRHTFFANLSWWHAPPNRRKRNDMAFQNTLPQTPISGIFGALRRMKNRFDARRQANARYDQAWRELSAMSRHEMADIGIDRSDIPRIAAEMAAQRRG